MQKELLGLSLAGEERQKLAYEKERTDELFQTLEGLKRRFKSIETEQRMCTLELKQKEEQTEKEEKKLLNAKEEYTALKNTEVQLLHLEKELRELDLHQEKLEKVKEKFLEYRNQMKELRAKQKKYSQFSFALEEKKKCSSEHGKGIPGCAGRNAGGRTERGRKVPGMRFCSSSVSGCLYSGSTV